jgi:hypothetical protein
MVDSLDTAVAETMNALSSQQSPSGTLESQGAELVITSAGISWPVEGDSSSCLSDLPIPTYKLCLTNQGKSVQQVPEISCLAVPGALLPAVQTGIQGSLPEGSLITAEAVLISGLPGAEGSKEGIIIVNNTPNPGSGAEGIIIVGGKPGDDLSETGIIIVNNFPGPDTQGEGIIIIGGMAPGNDASKVVGIIMEDMPAGGGDEAGIVIVDSMPDPDLSAKGIIIINSIPVEGEGSEGIVIVDSMPGPETGAEGIIIIEGLPGPDTGTEGIIIINGLPGPDQAAEGIIIVHGIPALGNASQLMGVKVAEFLGADQGGKGMIVLESKGASNQGGQAIVWGGMTADGETSHQLVLLNPGSAGLNQIGFPLGMEMGEGMTAMMGEGGFGPGPYLFGVIQMGAVGFPAELEPGEEVCVEVALSPESSGMQTGEYDSKGRSTTYTEVSSLWTYLPVNAEMNKVHKVESSIPNLPSLICTPEPSQPTATPTPDPHSPMPTQRPTLTPTIRTGNTQAPPTRRDTPTPTPSRGG